MEKYNINILLKRLIETLFLSILLWGTVGCQDPVTEWKVESEYQVMTEYVQSNDDYSEFSKFLESADVFRVLSTRGPFTLFLPTNDAVEKMYDRMGIESFEEIQEDVLIFIDSKLRICQSYTLDIELYKTKK